MRVDTRTLGTFNRLAHEGAKQAGAALDQLAGMDPTVEATAIDLASYRDVVAAVRGRDLLGVTIEFSGPLDGHALLVFGRAGARTLAKNLPGGSPDSEEAVRARIGEIGNILLSGFVDGWADYLDTTIEMSPPTTAAGSGTAVLPDEVSGDASEQVLAFTSRLETTTGAVDTSVYLFPDRDSFEAIVADHLEDGSAPIPLDRLQVFNRMTAKGTERASANITTMTGTETTVEVSRLRFLPVEQTAGALSGGRYAGVVVTLDGLPSGYLLILFDEASAATLAEQLGAGPVGDEFGPMHRSAIEEVGNIMSSGFIDGWANVLGTSIGHTPEFVHDRAADIVDTVTTDLATRGEYAFVFDSLIETTDRAVTCELLALPDEAELERALNSLTLDADTAADETALAEAMTADPDDVF